MQPEAWKNRKEHWYLQLVSLRRGVEQNEQSRTPSMPLWELVSTLEVVLSRLFERWKMTPIAILDSVVFPAWSGVILNKLVEGGPNIFCKTSCVSISLGSISYCVATRAWNFVFLFGCTPLRVLLLTILILFQSIDANFIVISALSADWLLWFLSSLSIL